MDNLESSLNTFPIDVIVPWVDTTDEAWINRYENTLNKPFKRSKRWSPESAPPDAELSLCLKLIRKNMPWIRNLFILTQQQDPKCRTENEILIDHSDIGLGLVFNSSAFEPSIYKVPGLSEHFLYLNDDFYVVRKVTRDLFFTDEGKTIIQFKEDSNPNDNLWTKTIKKTLKLYGSNKYFTSPHTPYAFTKSQMIAAEKLFPKSWEDSRNALERGDPGEINALVATFLTSKRNSTAIFDSESNLKYIYSDFAMDIGMFRHWFNINPPHVVCINAFNTTKEELYDSIEKTPRLYTNIIFSKNFYHSIYKTSCVYKNEILYIIIILIILICIYKSFTSSSP
jgi:hypothetical protein